MTCKVVIPAPLQAFTGGCKSVDVQGETVRSVLEELGKRYDGLLGRVCGSDGELRGFVNIYVNGSDSRALQGLDTPVADGDTIYLVPAIAGG